MSDLIKSFAFDLQRFDQFKGGQIPGEEGITLSKLFDSQGKVWQTSDVSQLGNRTYFWENEDAKVSLTPATDNADNSTVAGAITLVRGTYDNPASIPGDDGSAIEVGGKSTFIRIKSVDAIGVENVTGTATFANLDGVTRIINPGQGAKIDIEDDDLGAVTFGAKGTKSSSSDLANALGTAVGTYIDLDGQGNIQRINAAENQEVTTADGTKATFATGGTASLTSDSFDVINALAKNGAAELNVTNGSKVTLEVGNVVTNASDGTTAVSAKMDGQKITSVRFTNAQSGDIGLGGSEVVGQNVAIQGGIINVANITDSSEVLYKYGAAGGDIIDLTAKTTAKGTIAVSKTGNAKFVVASDLVKDGTDLTIGGTEFVFADAGANGGVFVTENNEVTGFVFRDINDALTVKKGQTEPKLYELKTSSAMNVSSKSGNESFDIVEATLPYKVTTTGADYTITKTANGYSIEVGEGDTVIENTATGAKISMTVPAASANTASTAALNFNEAGQLASITDGAASGGMNNTGLSGNGASLNLSGFTGSDIAGSSLQIGDISIDVPTDSEGSETPISYDQLVKQDGNTEITTNADIEAKSEDSPVTEANPYIFNGPDGALPTYLKNSEGDIYGIKIPADSSITGPFDKITELNEKAFDIERATDQTTYTFSNEGGTLKFAGLNSGDAIISGSGISEFITGQEGDFTVLGTAMAIAGDSEVTFTAAGGAVTGINGLSGTATGNFTNEMTVNGEAVQVTGDSSVRVEGNDAGVTMVGNLGGSAVDVVKAGSASQIGADGDGKLTLSYAGSGSYTVNGNDTLETVFDISGSNVTNITGLDKDETVNGILDNVTEINGESVAINNNGNVTSANVTSDGKLEFSGLTDGSSLSVPNAIANVIPNAGGSGTYNFAGHSITINGESTGVTFTTDKLGHVVGISGLDDGATFEDELSSGAKIAGMGFSVTETPNSLGGDGLFRVIGNNEGIARIEDLGGAVTVAAAGGASQLTTNAQIALANNADNKEITVAGDQAVTFALDEDGAITAIEGFGDVASTITGKINNISIGNAEIDIEGDNNFAYVTDGNSRYTLEGLDGNVKVNEKGAATVVSTTGDATINFFGEETFTIADEGKAYDEGTEVDFRLNDRDNVTAIDGLYGNVTGDFQDGVTVNGDFVQVDGDKEITVHGNDNGNGVDAIGGVDAKSTVKALGSTTEVSTAGAGVYTFVDRTTNAENKYTIAGDESVTFNLDNNGAVTGVSDLEGGSIVLDVANNTTVTLAVNPDVNDDVVVSADGKVTLTTDDEGKLVGIAGADAVTTGAESAVISAKDTITVTDATGVTTTVVVHDADESYSVITGERGAIASISAVTGDASINATSVYVVTDAAGQFTLNGGTSYTFRDDDGVIGMDINAAGALTAVDSLDGSIVAGAANIPADINGQDIAIASTATVTVTTDGEAITGVQGLEDNDAITGDLDNASITVPGTTDTNTYVNINVNGTNYGITDDEDGVTVNGSNVVTDLDEEANLWVAKGTYTVNGQKIEADGNNPIIGYDDGTKYAELYDPKTVLIRKNTDVGVIEGRLGLHTYDTVQASLGGEQIGGSDYTRTSTTVADPLTREQTDEIFSLATAGEFDLNRPLEIYADNYDEKDTQDLDLGGYNFTKKVHLYRGSQAVTVNSVGGNEVLVGDGEDTEAASGEKKIVLGGGSGTNAYGVGDVVVVDEASAIGNRVNITGGAGDDSVYVRNDGDVVFDMANGGADKLITFASSNARVTLSNYQASTGAGIQIEEPHARDSVGGIAEAIDEGKILFGDGIISVTTAATNGATNTAEVTFERGTDDKGTKVNLYTPDGTKQGVGFTDSLSGSVSSAESDDDFILIGNSVGNKRGSGTIVGGLGNDTVFAGEGDSIDAGAGNNVIVLDTVTANRGGAAIVLGAGNTTVKNTNNTFYPDHGDTLEVASPSNIRFDDTNLIVSGTGVNATIASVTADTIFGTATDSIGLQTGSKYVNQLVKDAEGKTWKMAVGGDSAVIDVKADEDIRADYYKAGGVTFENYNGAVQVDLSKGEDAWATTIDGVEAVFENVVSLEGGSGNTVFKGSEANETFIAGKGNTSLYGAGGKNLLVGYNDGSEGNKTKEGHTTFFILGQNGTAVNTIQNFAFVGDDNYTNNSIAADMIEIDVENNFVTANSVEVSNSDVVFSVENRTTGVRESVLVKDAAGKDMRVTDSVVAQVAEEELNFDKFANFYLATGKNATVKVSNDQDYSKVWLANPSLGTTFVGDIHVIDATNSSVTAELAGNDYNNSIYGGAGDTSLWGGNFGDDLLVGGTGKNTFYYALGNGADTIQGAKEGDVIDLTGVTIADVEAGVALGISQIDDSGVSIGFATGGTLRVDGTANVDYVVQGEKYTLNEDRTLFVKKS